MKLEQVLFPASGLCRLIVSATADELEASRQAVLAEKPNRTGDDLWNDAVNHAILHNISPVYHQAVTEHDLEPIRDPDFSLLTFDPAQGFTAAAEFSILPPLTLHKYTGFEEPIVPRPVREFDVLMAINQQCAEAYNDADETAKKEIWDRTAAQLYKKSCQNGESPTRLKLVQQLGDQVTGSLDESLLHQAYFDEMQRFFLRLEANHLSYDMYLRASHQSKEDWEAELHQISERKLRAELGLLMIAKKEKLSPTSEQVTQELNHWNSTKYGSPTFLANDIRRIRQRLSMDLARDFVLAHSTLTPPPAEFTVQKAES